MSYNIVAHPTKYNRVKFRSRLEARWAAFFDLIEWEWLYEPIDLSSWVPDFQLRNLEPDEENRLFGYDRACYIHKPHPFVEIKPFDDSELFDQGKISNALPDGSLCLLLGYSPFFEMCEIGKECLGCFFFL